MNPLMLPVVAAQGAWVRRTAEMAPPASGPMTGGVPGEGSAAIRVLVIGDSTAAGCGASTHENAFAGAFADLAARSTGRPVQWRVLGESGATSRRVRSALLPRLDEGDSFDIVVLLMGVNDVLARRSTQEWAENAAAVLDALTARADRVVMPGIPPFDRFPALPRALGRYLADGGRRLDRVAHELCSARQDVVWISTVGLLPEDPGFFAGDGFHPSSDGYRRWASEAWGRLAV